MGGGGRPSGELEAKVGGVFRSRFGTHFLRYADHKFALAEKNLAQQGSGRRKVGKTDYQAQGFLFIPDEARFPYNTFLRHFGIKTM